MNSSNQIQPITTPSGYYSALTHLPPENCTAKTNNGKIKQLSCTGYNLFEYNGYQIFFMYENNSPNTKKILVIKTEPKTNNGDRTFKTLGKITETSTITFVDDNDYNSNYKVNISSFIRFKTASDQSIIIPILQFKKKTDKNSDSDKPIRFHAIQDIKEVIKIITDGTSFSIKPLPEDTANTANTANTAISTESSEIETTENNPIMTPEAYKEFLHDNKLIGNFYTMFWMPITKDAFILYFTETNVSIKIHEGDILNITQNNPDKPDDYKNFEIKGIITETVNNIPVIRGIIDGDRNIVLASLVDFFSDPATEISVNLKKYKHGDILDNGVEQLYEETKNGKLLLGLKKRDSAYNNNESFAGGRKMTRRRRYKRSAATQKKRFGKPTQFKRKTTSRR